MSAEFMRETREAFDEFFASMATANRKAAELAELFLRDAGCTVTQRIHIHGEPSRETLRQMANRTARDEKKPR